MQQDQFITFKKPFFLKCLLGRCDPSFPLQRKWLLSTVLISNILKETFFWTFWKQPSRSLHPSFPLQFDDSINTTNSEHSKRNFLVATYNLSFPLQLSLRWIISFANHIFQQSTQGCYCKSTINVAYFSCFVLVLYSLGFKSNIIVDAHFKSVTFLWKWAQLETILWVHFRDDVIHR